MQAEIKRVQQAVRELQAGKIIILTDDESRENEGDFIIAAEKLTQSAMNFMVREGSGIVCLTLTPVHAKRLNLPLMIPEHENTSFVTTPFTISIDAKEVSGASVADRVKTIRLAMDETTKPEDLARPGHVFPLLAKQGGVFDRQGHTEGSIDLMRIAGLKPAGVLCEVMNPDGTMARGQQLRDFAEKHQLVMLSVNDIITYRLTHENLIEDQAETTLPLEKYGTFKMSVIKEKINEQEHIILSKHLDTMLQPPLVRIHSSCVTGDLFGSKRCDCHNELHYALERISNEGGILIYLNQEGRGIGLLNKIKAYALQDHGFDTVEANERLGLPVDSRKYYLAANILYNKGIKHVRLLTNNLDKVNDLIKYGITHVTQETMPVFHNEHNYQYLMTKKEKLNHTIDLDQIA